MPLPKQTPRKELLRKLRVLGWDGPYIGSKHPFMKKGTRKLKVPNPHDDPIYQELLSRILFQAQITDDEWDSV